MQLLKLALSVLAAATTLTQAAPALEPRGDFCLRYNTRDCRNFELYRVNTDEVEKFITIGTKDNIDPRVPDYLHGVFYMKGNPLPDEVLSLAGGVYDEKEKAYFLKVYDENIWSWDDNREGRLLYDAVRTFGLIYKATWDHSQPRPVVFVEPVFNPPFWLGNGEITIKPFFANFTIIPTADPNYFIRRSSFLQQSVSDYEFMKIVYPNGTRTEKYETEYLPMINKTTYNAPPGFSTAITLGATQLFARVKKD
ncbi:hypothetical protein HDU96_004471 [Phlyctochytrium bullatum]|nr:hypothetical protein HDU96_004471 [Phlyctochytrium bullatum]